MTLLSNNTFSEKKMRKTRKTGHSERTYVIFDVDDEREDLNNHGRTGKDGI